MEYANDRGGRDQRNHRSGKSPVELTPCDEQHEREHRDTDGPGVHRAGRAREYLDLLDELRGNLRDAEAKEILDLVGRDDDGDARREARDERVGNELDDRAQL